MRFFGRLTASIFVAALLFSAPKAHSQDTSSREVLRTNTITWRPVNLGVGIHHFRVKREAFGPFGGVHFEATPLESGGETFLNLDALSVTLNGGVTYGFTDRQAMWMGVGLGSHYKLATEERGDVERHYRINPMVGFMHLVSPHLSLIGGVQGEPLGLLLGAGYAW